MISTFAIALGMSADAFAAALGKGAALDRPRISEALRAGAVFATIEMLAPLLGWGLGLAASPLVAAVDHWIAFALLGGVGLKMCRESLYPSPARVSRNRHSLATLTLTALGTSIDALVVGMSLAFVGSDILRVAVAIGLATFVMTTGGMLVGRLAGASLGRVAEAAGGLLLIAIGARILVTHLGA